MKSFCVGFLAVLAAFSGTVLSESAHDRFYTLFKAKAPFPQILIEVFDNNSATQLEHLQVIQQHIDANDKFTTYAKQLKAACQEVLNSSLHEIGYQGKPLNIGEFMQAMHKLENQPHIENRELEEVVRKLMQRKQQVSQATGTEKNEKLHTMASDAMSAVENSTKVPEVEQENAADDEIADEVVQAPIRRSAPVSARSSSEAEDNIEANLEESSEH